jgi:uncharacterized protein (DUF2384 family)
MNAERPIFEPVQEIDPKLMHAAIGLFHDRALAIGWLAKPMRGLGGKRPLDVDTEEAMVLIARLEHGIVA